MHRLYQYSIHKSAILIETFHHNLMDPLLGAKDQKGINVGILSLQCTTAQLVYRIDRGLSIWSFKLINAHIDFCIHNSGTLRWQSAHVTLSHRFVSQEMRRGCVRCF